MFNIFISYFLRRQNIKMYVIPLTYQNKKKLVGYWNAEILVG